MCGSLIDSCGWPCLLIQVVNAFRAGAVLLCLNGG